ncbi:MAG: glucans biosynthesis glucosyltransferase MdoH [Hyphomicrobium sp.]
MSNPSHVDEATTAIAAGTMHVQHPTARKDASDPALLPAEAPLTMPPQDLSKKVAFTIDPTRRGSWIPRAAVLVGALSLTFAFAYELYGVLSFVAMTPIQFVFLILSTITFGWIAFGSLSAAMGFLPLFAGDHTDTLEVPSANGPLESRTALLFPVYHEEPHRIAGTIAAMAEELVHLGKAAQFDIFILSDTRGADEGQAEEACYRELAAHLDGVVSIYYRRRIENTARKSGNVEDWVERFGGAYENFIILDGDSVMSGEAVVRLARAMEQDQRAGLIQSIPRLTGGTTLLQRLQQYASNVYGPAVAGGLASWHRDQGNYWGHNAIIRTAAFASAAGLPILTGRKPFGGPILSHDFVEAALLQRAGWGVHMVPSVPGSYEGMPPGLIDLVVRDRRWAQGNLQHLALIPRRGLSVMGRVHLSMGAFAYVVSAIWALSLATGIVLALQSQQLIPSYFQDSKTLFPIWPVIDPGAAMRLFLGTMAVVLLPKALGLALELKRAAEARELFGTPRALAAVLVETFFSMLLAPILMMTQTVAVVQILSGMDSGWKAQRRDDGSVPLAFAMRFHAQHMAAGAIIAGICWIVSPGLLLWMLPVIAGLVLAGPLNWLTSQRAGEAMSALLSTWDDRDPPSILIRARELATDWQKRFTTAAVAAKEPANDSAQVNVPRAA